jgi:hypothetical protein
MMPGFFSSIIPDTSAFLRIVPIEETYLTTVQLSEKVRLTPAMVRLNYMDRSPFAEGGLAWVREGSQLFLWFTRLESAGSRLEIPEGYLLYRAHRDAGEAVIVHPKETCVSCLVIKEGRLRGQVVIARERWSEEYEAELLQLLAREHSLADPVICRVDSSFQLRPSWAVIRACTHLEIDPSRMLTRGFDLLKGPLILYLAILISYQLFSVAFVENRRQQLQEKVIEIKERNQPFKKRYGALQDEVAFWNGFAGGELRRPNFRQLLARVAEAVSADSGSILNLSYSGLNATARIQTGAGAPELVRRLMEGGYFQEVKIVSSRQVRQDKSLQELDLALTLKRASAAREPEQPS